VFPLKDHEKPRREKLYSSPRDAFFSKSRKETLMHSLSGALASRYLAILLAVLLMLVLLTVLFLVHAHLGGMPMLAQSTETILE
jgi:1,4-dihydroxy-2-naphthoate octaprenyltransferase